MSHPVTDTLRSRLDARAILLACALVGLSLAFDVSRTHLLTTVTVAAITGTSTVLADAYELRDGVEHAPIGALGLFYGTATFALGDEPVWLGAGFLVLGGWFALDAVQTVRHGGVTVTEDDRDGREVYRAYVTRRVHETLQGDARTRRELGEALDADERSIDTAVSRLRDRDLVVRRGSELRVRETDEQPRARRWLAGTVGRIARPVTVELRGASSRPDT